MFQYLAEEIFPWLRTIREQKEQIKQLVEQKEQLEHILGHELSEIQRWIKTQDPLIQKKIGYLPDSKVIIFGVTSEHDHDEVYGGILDRPFHLQSVNVHLVEMYLKWKCTLVPEQQHIAYNVLQILLILHFIRGSEDAAKHIIKRYGELNVR